MSNYCKIWLPSTFSALALIILFSVLPKISKILKNLYVEKLEYLVEAAIFEPTPSSLNPYCL